MSTGRPRLPADLIQPYAGVSAGSEDDRPDRVNIRRSQAADQRGEALKSSAITKFTWLFRRAQLLRNQIRL